MRAMARFGVVAAAAVAVAGSAWAQPFSVPPGRWWERPRVAEQLSLTVEQRKALDEMALAHAKAMVDLKGEVEKAELDLRVASEVEPLDVKRVREMFAALQQRRTRLEQERFEMLLKVREVLTTEQWKKLAGLLRDVVRRDAGGAANAPEGPRRPLRPRVF